MDSSWSFPHSSINIVKQAFITADVSCILETMWSFRTDSKRLDDLTLIPWTRDWFLVWDVICFDSVAASHAKGSCFHLGSTAAFAEFLIHEKYAEIKYELSNLFFLHLTVLVLEMKES